MLLLLLLLRKLTLGYCVCVEMAEMAEDSWAAQWREEEREKRMIAEDVVWEDGRVCRASQTEESSFTKEKPMAIVLPNAHLKDAVAWRQPPGNRSE